MNRTQAQLDARLTMPLTPDGYVVSLFYVPAKQLPEYEAKWGVWLKSNPKHLWPSWAPLWIEKRKLEHASA